MTPPHAQMLPHLQRPLVGNRHADGLAALAAFYTASPTPSPTPPTPAPRRAPRARLDIAVNYYDLEAASAATTRHRSRVRSGGWEVKTLAICGVVKDHCDRFG